MAIVIAATFIWSVIMVTVRRLDYATALGSGGVGATLMTAKWRPFDRVGRARDLAEQGDVLATGLRLRMTTIGLIADPRERHEAEWRAVKEYTTEALGMRKADRQLVPAPEQRDAQKTRRGRSKAQSRGEKRAS